MALINIEGREIDIKDIASVKRGNTFIGKLLKFLSYVVFAILFLGILGFISIFFAIVMALFSWDWTPIENLKQYSFFENLFFDILVRIVIIIIFGMFFGFLQMKSEDKESYLELKIKDSNGNIFPFKTIGQYWVIDKLYKQIRKDDNGFKTPYWEINDNYIKIGNDTIKISEIQSFSYKKPVLSNLLSIFLLLCGVYSLWSLLSVIWETDFSYFIQVVSASPIYGFGWLMFTILPFWMIYENQKTSHKIVIVTSGSKYSKVFLGSSNKFMINELLSLLTERIK
ncbi:hypothetical protein [Psychrobacter sp. I-STPA10]|uniref:hypothetical protein n=1 Tax=Psychrobacter sp. I-STPA10 TaxID=2585769 RepID=UPI001E2DD3F6|nr:hypothetical protein [Psychrobacter sp. I-STPA10]